jgi:hypothetical protein
MTARQAVIDALTAQVGPGLPLDGVRVIGYARTIDPPTTPTVLVRVDTVTPGGPLRQAWRTYGFALVLIPPTTEAGTADDELDAFLEDVLHAVEQAPDLTWTRAQRGTYQDTTYPAYEVTLDVPFTKETP